MQFNRTKGVIEKYVGEREGKDYWETVYNPRNDNSDKLAMVIADIRKEERDRFKEKLKRFIAENC